MAVKKLNSPRKSKDGKALSRADSRAAEDTTYFTMRGDSTTVIGDGKVMAWDFSTSDDIVTDSTTTEIPSGYKRKRMKISFVDPIHVKEGTMYWLDAPFGCYIDFWVMCPTGQYYLDRDGVAQQASSDTPLVHYVNHHRIMGDCTMGDELNTESATENPIPATYELWIEITTPTSDTISKGHSELEIYRTRTHLLPGESV